jgi:CubicO group peptidase (beta-lactamase class C family)
LKILLPISLLIIYSVACNVYSGDKTAPDDSLQYYPPTPGAMDPVEFRFYYRELSRFFDSTLFRTNFNGGVLVAKNGVVLFEKYKGRPDLRKPDSITANTPFHVASVSKTFMGIAILRLVQENRLSLNDSINSFFPDFPYPGITVQMLLNHRSGIPNYLYFMDKSDWDKKIYATNEDVLNIIYRDKPARSFPPDKRFSYSNTNFILLAMIIEKVTGQSYPDYMKEQLFTPLQMNNTYVFTLKDTLSAIPSFTAGGTYWNNDFLEGTYGDKNIYSTPQDILKFDQALYTNQVIRPTLLDSAFTPYSNERASIHNYGLGWRLQMLPNGKKIIYHFGKWHGFNAAFARLTDEKVTIIILGNRFTRAVYNSAHACYDVFGNYLHPKEMDADEADSQSTAVPQSKAKLPARKRR